MSRSGGERSSNMSTPAGSLFVNRRGRQMTSRDVAPGSGPALAGTDASARAAPHLCNPSRRWRGGSASRPGVARSREPEDDGDLHPRVHRAAGQRLPKALTPERDDPDRHRSAPVSRELWADFKSTADHSARDRLILHYSPLVKYVAGRVAAAMPSHVDYADLVSYGISG